MTSAATGPASLREAERWPRFLGRYELIAELASGGMGTVYLARHAGEAGFQRLFAVKVLHPHLAAEEGFVSMLQDEGRLAARLHHPNVVAVLDIGTQDDRHYVIMEYVDGASLGVLYQRSRANRPLPVILSIIIDALEGLHAAHSLTDDYGEAIRLVHRDVSPHNVLVSADGIARITDFGIAKAESRIASTQPGTRKGKLLFMAPEQVLGREVDHRADIWAAGVMLWMTLTGTHLFKGENDAASLNNLLVKPIPPPSTLGAKPPVCLDAIVLRALERDPDKRFATALEMAEALREAAVANGLVGSRHQVGRWVTELFGKDLDRRREATRLAALRRSTRDSTGISRVAPLPVIPPISPTPVSSDGLGLPEFKSERAVPRTLPLSEPPEPLSARHIVELESPGPDARPSARRWVFTGALAIAAGTLLWLVLSSRSSPVAEAVRAEEQARSGAAQSTGTMPPPSASETRSVATSAPLASSPATSRDTPASPGPTAARTGRGRAGGLRAVPPRASSPAPALIAPAKPVPAEAPPPPAPRNAPASETFEKNPYLGR